MRRALLVALVLLLAACDTERRRCEERGGRWLAVRCTEVIVPIQNCVSFDSNGFCRQYLTMYIPVDRCEHVCEVRR